MMRGRVVRVVDDFFGLIFFGKTQKPRRGNKSSTHEQAAPTYLHFTLPGGSRSTYQMASFQNSSAHSSDALLGREMADAVNSPQLIAEHEKINANVRKPVIAC